jgi:hypothetical protein
MLDQLGVSDPPFSVMRLTFALGFARKAGKGWEHGDDRNVLVITRTRQIV